LVLVLGKITISSFAPKPTPIPTPLPISTPTPTPEVLWQGYQSENHGLLFAFPPNYLVRELPSSTFIKHSVQVGDTQSDFLLDVEIFSRTKDKSGHLEKLFDFAKSFHDYHACGRTTLPTPVVPGTYSDILPILINTYSAYTFSSLVCPQSNYSCSDYFLATNEYFYRFSFRHSPAFPYKLSQILSSIKLSSKSGVPCTQNTDICDPASCSYTPEKCVAQSHCTKSSDCQIFYCDCQTSLSTTFLKSYTGARCNISCNEYVPVCTNFTCQSVHITPTPTRKP
jgi:hypothetical protein